MRYDTRGWPHCTGRHEWLRTFPGERPGGMPARGGAQDNVRKAAVVVNRTNQPSAEAEPKTVVIVDNERIVRTLYELGLTNAGYQVAAAVDMASGLALCEHLKPDVVIVDIFLPEPSGLELIRRLRMQGSPPGIIAVTGAGTVQHVDALFAAKEAGADVTLRKPIPWNVLLEAVAELVGAPCRSSDETPTP
jgi:CheY-like chemotaxis protein